MMSVKTAKDKTCNPKKQDTSVLPPSINVGVLSFLYLLVAIFILKVVLLGDYTGLGFTGSGTWFVLSCQEIGDKELILVCTDQS